MAKTLDARPCESCGDMYDPVRVNQKYCTSSCKKQRKRFQRTCEHCGKTYGTNEKVSKYCSKSCSATVTNTSHPKRMRQERPACAVCGKEVAEMKLKYCSPECRTKDSLAGRFTDEQRRDMYNAQMREYMRARRHKRLGILRGMFGGKCGRCGSTDRLEFDHIDRTAKTIEVSNPKLLDGPWSKILTEVAKCQLLCKRCHIEKSREYGDHAYARNPRPVPEHGSENRYVRGCRCDACREARRDARIRRGEQSGLRRRRPK